MLTLSKLTPPLGVLGPVVTPDTESLLRDARSRLRQAMRMRDAASAVVADKQAAIDRIQRLIEQADVAHDALESAEQASANFTKMWAENGAHADKPSIDPELKRQVAEAAAELHAATVAADGAKSGLPSAESALMDARLAFDGAQSAVNQAVAAVLAAMTEGALIMAQQAGEQFQVAADQVQVMVRVLAGHWHRFSNDVLANELLHRLRDLAPASLPERAGDLFSRQGEAYIAGGKRFVELGHALLNDADATNP